LTSNPIVNAPKIKTIWIILLIVILIATGSYYYFKAKPSTQGAGNAEIQTAVARRGNLVLSANGTGTLISQTDATFGFKTSGQVTQVNIKIGDQVTAGQVLAQLDDSLAQINYIEAQQALQELYSAASIANTQQGIATAKDTEFAARTWLAYLISPDVVDAEEILANAEQKLSDAQNEANANPSEAASKKVQENEATVTYLKEKLAQTWTYYQNVYGPETFTEYQTVGHGRNRRQVAITYTDPITGKQLPKIDWPSADDLAKARNNYAQAKQAIKDGENYLQAITTGVIPVEATGTQLGGLNDAQLAVKNAQAALDSTKLIAPIGGTISAIDLHVGEQGNTTSAVTISQLSQPYIVDVSLDQTDWGVAKVGNKVNVTFDLLPGKTFPGNVTVVYPELNSSGDAPLVHIQAQLDQSISQNLPAGTGVSIEVVGGDANNAVLVPASAVHKNNSGGYEVSVIQNGKQKKQRVEIGLQGTAYVEIKSGLDAGTIVATK
jgi:HlyD family secretion protein